MHCAGESDLAEIWKLFVFYFCIFVLFLNAVCGGLGCQEVSSSGQVCKLIHHALGFGSFPTLELGVRLHSPTFRGKESSVFGFVRLSSSIPAPTRLLFSPAKSPHNEWRLFEADESNFFRDFYFFHSPFPVVVSPVIFKCLKDFLYFYLTVSTSSRRASSVPEQLIAIHHLQRSF